MLPRVRARLQRLLDRRRETRRVVRELRGMPVVLENPYPNIDDGFVLQRLDAALALIEARQPTRFRHFRRDVDRIWVTRYPARGVYLPAQRTVMTEVTFLNRAAEFPVAQVAASILHEGVHARVHRMGQQLGFRRAWPRAEEERLCRRAEVAFAHTLPPDEAAPILARATAVLAASTSDEEAAPTVDWRQAELNKYAEDLEQLELSPWVRRALLALARWRLKSTA